MKIILEGMDAINYVKCINRPKLCPDANYVIKWLEDFKTANSSEEIEGLDAAIESAHRVSTTVIECQL